MTLLSIRHQNWSINFSRVARSNYCEVQVNENSTGLRDRNLQKSEEILDVRSHQRVQLIAQLLACSRAHRE